MGAYLQSDSFRIFETEKPKFAEENTDEYKGALIVVKDCSQALKFHRDLFGVRLLQDNDGNMELTSNLYLQESGYWDQFMKRSVIPNSNHPELYFEEPYIT